LPVEDYRRKQQAIDIYSFRDGPDGLAEPFEPFKPCLKSEGLYTANSVVAVWITPTK
jgi:hypothetical protein